MVLALLRFDAPLRSFEGRKMGIEERALELGCCLRRRKRQMF